MPRIELSDFATAYSMVMMQLDERGEYETEQDYFEAVYDVNLEQLSDFFAKFINGDYSIEKAFLACSIFYELGRKHQQVVSDTPTTV